MKHIKTPENWQILSSPQEVAEKAVKLICEAAQQAIKKRKGFYLVTAGGTTPMLCYKLLSELNFAKNNIEWEKWHIYMGDERCLSPDNQERNSFALYQAWLKSSKIPQENIHLIPAEQGSEIAKNNYKKSIQNIELFDLVMLGMGEDGHTASLFPNHTYSNESVVTELNSPKMPLERVSLSYERLSKSRRVLKLITGSGKQSAIKQWLAQEDLPITKIIATAPLGVTNVLLDKEALPDE